MVAAFEIVHRTGSEEDGIACGKGYILHNLVLYLTIYFLTNQTIESFIGRYRAFDALTEEEAMVVYADRQRLVGIGISAN